MNITPQNPSFDAVRVIPGRENPSYGTEFPQDFPYDPGQTNTIFELGYIPKQASVLPLAIVGALGIAVIILVLKQKKAVYFIAPILAIFSLLLVSLGPMTLPLPIGPQTTLGIAKLVCIFTILLGIIDWAQRKIFPPASMKSLLPIGLYLLSQLSSVFVMTNPTFFLQDFGLILTGLLFFVMSYMWLHNPTVQSKLIKAINIVSLMPIALVLLVYVSPGLGKSIISAIYPRYEGVVFQFDYARGRILSIFDIEFFAPVSLAAIGLFGGSISQWAIYLLLSLSVFLTNYRYRFLTFVIGSVATMYIMKTQIKKQIALIALTGFFAVFTGYLSIQTLAGNPTIVDRFLLKSYSNDVDSLRRRIVMLGQAWNIFTQHPLLGVGTGNYKDNVDVVYESFGGRYYEPYYKILQNVYAYPHNWFIQILAENGIIGMMITWYMLYVFSSIDRALLRRLKGKNRVCAQTFIIISWLYIFANQFTPLSNSLPMVIIFWSFRGILEREHSNLFTNVIT